MFQLAGSQVSREESEAEELADDDLAREGGRDTGDEAGVSRDSSGTRVKDVSRDSSASRGKTRPTKRQRGQPATDMLQAMLRDSRQQESDTNKKVQYCKLL